MHQTSPAAVIVILLAVAAGCQTTGMRPTEPRPDELTFSRTFPPRFDTVKNAMQQALQDHDAMREIAGFDYSRPVQASSLSWKTPFHKVATRDMESGERTLKVKVEQKSEGVVVTVRLSTGTPGDPARSAILLDRIGELANLQPVRR
jgi:hypothetical protein